MRKSTDRDQIDILAISGASLTVHVLGTSPLIFHRMSEKAKRELLLPRGRKTAADKASQLKHEPIQEYRASVYRYADDTHPTRLRFPAAAFKSAMATAALDLPGAKRSEIGRLTWVEGADVDIYGVPQLYMSVVRSSDIARTPDVRTRAIVARWACKVRVNFVAPKLTAQGVANLLSAAGVTVGIGDFRQEKGKGNFGQFVLVDEDDAQWREIAETGGREAQDEALANPQPYDEEAREMIEWFESRVVALGRNAA
jgi:hypothetical protein